MCIRDRYMIEGYSTHNCNGYSSGYSSVPECLDQPVGIYLELDRRSDRSYELVGSRITPTKTAAISKNE